ncbi:MAG: NAD-dependent epimerase/dehydratase family protein [Thaumarchaeota archaeon]|nr:NAD-dependent epimerase/dehydratase family protein [Nitrososphaerota archaeon]
MNLLVGATGFVGGHIVEYLFQQGEISKGTFRKGSHLKIMDASGVQGMEADLLDHHSLHEAMEGADTIYNIASPMPDSDTDFVEVNTEGLLNLLEVATELGVKTLIHLSTLDVCGFGTRELSESSPVKPVTEYQKGKAEAERILGESAKRTPSLRVVIIRAARAVGSRDESLTIPLLRMIESGKVVLPGSSSMSFSHPQDIAQAMYKAATGQVPSGSLYLVKSFDATPEALSRELVTAVGAEAEVRKEGLFSKSLLGSYASEQLKASLAIEAQSGWKQLGYSPVFNSRTTCEEIARWYKKEPWATDRA